MHSCNIVYTCGGKQVFETAAYLKNIDEFLNYHLGVQFDEIIGDFIKDEAGIWWFINLKGFVLRNDILIDGRPITNYGEENSDVVGRKKEVLKLNFTQ